MALIDDVKTELRISGTDFNTEVQLLIDTAKADLEQSGVRKVVDTDYLTRSAIILFCKGNFGWDNPEAERFIRLYEALRAKLAVARDFASYLITFTVTDSADDSALADATIVVGNVVLLTNSLGKAYYHVYEKLIDVDYAVSKLGYTAKTGSVYIDGTDEAVAVAL